MYVRVIARQSSDIFWDTVYIHALMHAHTVYCILCLNKCATFILL